MAPESRLKSFHQKSGNMDTFQALSSLASADTALCVLHFHRSDRAFPGGVGRFRISSLKLAPRLGGLPDAHHPQTVSPLTSSTGSLLVRRRITWNVPRQQLTPW